MDAVIRALLGAARSVVHPTILVVLLVPMGIALLVWVALSWAFWTPWVESIRSLIVDHASFSWTAGWDMARVAGFIAMVLLVLLLAPAILVTALLIAALLAMPVLVNLVAGDAFPGLSRSRGGTLIGSLWNALVAVGVFVMLWIVTLPLWLLGPVAVVLPLALSAWLNQRLFRYDALAEHASPAEMKWIFEHARARLFLLGLITGLLYFIPPFNLVGPVFAALAFIHLCLDELQRLRAGGATIEGASYEVKGKI